MSKSAAYMKCVNSLAARDDARLSRASELRRRWLVTLVPRAPFVLLTYLGTQRNLSMRPEYVGESGVVLFMAGQMFEIEINMVMPLQPGVE